MKKYYLLFICVLFLGKLFSQTSFEKTYDVSSEDIGYSVVATESGYFFTGSVYDDVNLDYDVFVTKVKLNGEVVWTKTYSGIGVGDDEAYHITQTVLNHLLITGYTTNVDSGDYDAFILKIDENGNEIWNQTYDGGYYMDDEANYIVEASDGGILVCGYTTDTNYVQYMWVFQTDGNGNILWDNTFEINGFDEANCVIETEDGGMVLVGSSMDTILFDIDGVLIKLDENGDEDWTYYTTGLNDEFFTDCIIDENGNYILVGSEEDLDFGDYDYLLEKVSSSGENIYSYLYDFAEGDDFAHRIYTKDGEVFLVGSVENLSGDLDAYIAWVNVADGNLIDNLSFGDKDDQEFLDFDFTKDSGFVCVGYSGSADNSDIYLVKIGMDQTISVKSIVENSFVMYPNPATTSLRFSTSITSDNAILTIVDIAGRNVYSEKVNGNFGVVDLSNFDKGIYQLIVSVGDETVANEKLVVI